jgi:AcrR family transcriptional regulator
MLQRSARLHKSPKKVVRYVELVQKLVESGQVTDPQSARGKLLTAAAHLFRIKGYDRTTVRDMAASLGIQSGSLFHHYKSKEEILKAVMRETIIINTAKLRVAKSQSKSHSQELYCLILEELASIQGEGSDALTVLVHEWRTLSNDVRSELMVLRGEYEDVWQETLVPLFKAGKLADDPVIIRRLLIGALAWTTNWFRAEGNLTLDELAQKAFNLVTKP